MHFVGPNQGSMACGEWGVGRMAEPAEIAARALSVLERDRSKTLAGSHVLITAGPTFEPIDPVRFIGNRSSGKQGYAIATAAAELGARVTLIAGPTALADPHGVEVVHVATARTMLEAVQNALPADIAIFSAAVADWRADSIQMEKIKKGRAVPHLKLVENPDILKTISHLGGNRPRLVIGFAAETENVLAHAAEKLESKGCDWIVANDVSPKSGVFGGDSNAVHLITRSNVESWPEMSKDGVARRLAQAAQAWLEQQPRQEASAGGMDMAPE